MRVPVPRLIRLQSFTATNVIPVINNLFGVLPQANTMPASKEAVWPFNGAGNHLL